VDVIDQASVVEMLASQYPSLNLIIPHLGSFRDDWRAQQQVVDQLVRYPNVYADTSGVRRFDYIVQAVRRAGAHKILYGSDGPWLHPGAEMYKIRLLRLPPRKEALILGQNAARLLSKVRSTPRTASQRHCRLQVLRGARAEPAGPAQPMPGAQPTEYEL
jgi:predicted TIM-barrel fold metal-dependent hydrolase